VVEQRDIEIFLTLAEELHFGRTAERPHVSTARVSQTIKKLERRIGAALFERTSRHVALTPIGRRLDDDLRPAYEQIREGIGRAIASGRGIEWRLSGPRCAGATQRGPRPPGSIAGGETLPSRRTPAGGLVRAGQGVSGG
jgi:DNA-binding transcriptional LysR family regulator